MVPVIAASTQPSATSVSSFCLWPTGQASTGFPGSGELSCPRVAVQSPREAKHLGDLRMVGVRVSTGGTREQGRCHDRVWPLGAQEC